MQQIFPKTKKINTLGLWIVVCSAIVLVYTILSILFCYFYIYQHDRVRLDLQLNEMVKREADRVKTFFDAQQILIRSLSLSLQDNSLEAARQIAQEIVQKNPYNHLWIADKEGWFINEFGEALDVSGRDYFSRAMQGETVVTNVFQSLQGIPLVVVATPMFGFLGSLSETPVAVLLGAFHKEHLTESLQKNTHDGTGSVFIMDKSHVMITNPTTEIANAMVAFFQKTPDTKSGTNVIRVSGVDYYLNMADATISDWVVCALTPVEDKQDDDTDLGFLLLLPLAIILCVSFLGIILLVHKNHKAMRFRDEKFQLAIGQLNSLMFEYDLSGDVIEFIKTSDNVGLEFEEGRISNPEELGDRFTDMTEESSEAYKDVIRKIKKGAKTAQCTIEILHDDAKSKYFSVTITSVLDAAGKPYYALGTINDVTKKIELEKSLTDKANHDVLTGLSNRISFETAVKKALSEPSVRNKTHAFIVCDIDNFKQINDTFGHLTGDVILQKVANVFNYIFPSTDMVARFGGDEFTIFMNDIASEKVAVSRARMICEEIDNLIISDDIQEKFTLSLGISFAPNDGMSFNELYGKADAALYRAKHFVGNSYIVYDSFNESDGVRLKNLNYVEPIQNGEDALDAELDLFYREMQTNSAKNRADVARFLKAALGNHEIEPYIQSKHNTTTRELDSAEVLARWNSPKYGLLSPNRFIPLFEKYDLIEELDLYMLHETCKLLKKWKEKGFEPISISVNQSPNLILMRGYTDIVKAEVESLGIDPRYLWIEITERAVFSSYRIVTKIVKELTEFGITVSLDDFGSGYTSLNMLKNLYIGELKIDKQFIDRLSFHKARAHIIIKHIVALAKEMGIRTTMEGVETEEQAEFVATVGCDTLQGYLFARPMTAKQFEEKYLSKEESPR